LHYLKAVTQAFRYSGSERHALDYYSPDSALLVVLPALHYLKAVMRVFRYSDSEWQAADCYSPGSAQAAVLQVLYYLKVVTQAFRYYYYSDSAPVAAHPASPEHGQEQVSQRHYSG